MTLSSALKSIPTNEHVYICPGKLMHELRMIMILSKIYLENTHLENLNRYGLVLQLHIQHKLCLETPYLSSILYTKSSGGI